MGRPGELNDLLEAARDAGAGDVLGETYRRYGLTGARWEANELWRELGLLDSDGRFRPEAAEEGLHRELVSPSPTPDQQ